MAREATAGTARKERLRAELEAARVTFHTILASLSDAQLRQPSKNPAWTNQQLVFHMAFGFFLLPSLIRIVLVLGRLPLPVSRLFARLLNSVTVPFNWINAAGPSLVGPRFTRRALAATFDRVHAHVLRRIDAIREDDLELGMYYPSRWEPLFQDYMTLEDILRYPVLHVRSHLQHINHVRSDGGVE